MATTSNTGRASSNSCSRARTSCAGARCSRTSPACRSARDNFAGRLRRRRATCIAQGRRHIAFLGHASSHYPEFFDRYRGYERALREARIATSAVAAGGCDQHARNRATRLRCELQARGVEFDAIVAASDLIAIGALRALQERGIDVPRQVSVVGFDDIPAASLTNPPLTTVMQDTRRAGELLVETLLRQVAWRDRAATSCCPTRLVVRAPVGPVALPELSATGSRHAQQIPR